MRTRTATRYVEHTIDGKTRLVPDEYDAPAPPRDWDQIALNIATGIATTGLVAAMAWSTASIGDLLDRVTVAPAAYAAAGTFDAAWILCLIVEWLCRYEPERAKTAARAGWVALAIVMAALTVHGHLDGTLSVGLVGAAVSALAKGGFTIVMGYHARPLDARTLAWLRAEAAEIDGSLALIPARRRLTRSRALLDAEQAALGPGSDADPDASGQSGPNPAANVVPITPGAMTSKDAVRIAWDSGIRDRDAVVRAASKILGKAISPDTVDRYLRAIRVGA
ncbi:protein transporter Sec31 [Streptomyces sp. NPDC001941]|uniref:protein transporter Sec31 n=1 Tax=Streptomyces sp. NPDC001941 TaxID=3154659 RepID=UPI00331E2C0E